MKKVSLLILAGLFWISFGFSTNGNLKVADYKGPFTADTIKTSSFIFHASRTTVANNPTGIKSMLDSIKSYPESSYVLARRIATDKWVVETNPDVSSISNYAPKRISLIEGDIRIMRTKYNTRYAVIMDDL